MVVKNAPAFAILGEEVKLTLRIEDIGVAPVMRATVIDIAVDGEEPQRFQMPIGEDVELPIRLPHGGRNVIEFSTPGVDGEVCGIGCVCCWCRVNRMQAHAHGAIC